MNANLVDTIRRFVSQAAPELSEALAESLELSVTLEHVKSLPHIPSPAMQGLVMDIVRMGRMTGRTPNELALAIRAARAVESHHRKSPHLELVLSGPTFPPFELRRTDEALLQLIQQARRRLTLISFALYRVERLTRALCEAVERSVEIRLFVGTDLQQSAISTLYGNALASQMQVYVWAANNRARSVYGGQGVLHAKATIADGQTLFISSANLTEYALSVNIELGILIQGGEYPYTVERIFDTYITQGVFERHSLY